jgi:hypothetical protein
LTKFSVFCSISSKLLLVVFCRLVTDPKVYAAQKHLVDFPTNYSSVG